MSLEEPSRSSIERKLDASSSDEDSVESSGNDQSKTLATRIELPSEAHETNTAGNSALHSAARSGNSDFIAILNERSADINARNSDGYTPLHLAAKNGNSEITTVLLENVAEVDKTNLEYKTALYFAAAKGHVDAVKVLLSYKADSNIRNIEGETALMAATIGNHHEVMRELLRKSVGTDVNMRNYSFQTALHIACHADAHKGCSCRVIDGERCESVESGKILLECGIDIQIDATGHLFNTALHEAAMNSTELVTILLEHGADVNKIALNDNTPLIRAAQWGNDKAVSPMLKSEYKADLNMQNVGGMTALNMAADRYHVKMVEILLRHGADVNVQDLRGFTAFHTALFFPDEDVGKYIYIVRQRRQTEEKGRKGDDDEEEEGEEIGIQIDDGEYEYVRKLIYNREEVIKILRATNAINEKALDFQGRTPLSLQSNAYSILKSLIETYRRRREGHDGDLCTAEEIFDPGLDKFGMTFLHRMCTAEVDISALVKFLGRDKLIHMINLQDYTGRTALHYAAMSDVETTNIKSLVEAGCDINLQDNYGRTTAHYAAIIGRKYKLCLQNEAREDIRDINGKTSKDYREMRDFGTASKKKKVPTATLR